MSNWTRREQEYDRIAASRLARLNGGVPRHIALGSRAALSLRWKLARMGLEGPHIDHAVALVDELSLAKILDHHPIGVRFATIPRAKRDLEVWDVGIN
jgi:hypothetical protein